MFGMGTGGPSLQSTPTYFLVNKKVSKENFMLAWFRMARVEIRFLATRLFSALSVLRKVEAMLFAPSKLNKVPVVCLASACIFFS